MKRQLLPRIPLRHQPHRRRHDTHTARMTTHPSSTDSDEHTRLPVTPDSTLATTTTLAKRPLGSSTATPAAAAVRPSRRAQADEDDEDDELTEEDLSIENYMRRHPCVLDRGNAFLDRHPWLYQAAVLAVTLVGVVLGSLAGLELDLSNTHFAVMYAIIALSLALYAVASRRSPGRVPPCPDEASVVRLLHSWPTAAVSAHHYGLHASEWSRSWSSCDICANWRPARAHHCSKCGRCVLLLDHHCVWIGTCIAAGTLVSRGDGTSARIEEVQVGTEVQALAAPMAGNSDAALNLGLAPRPMTAVLDNGERACLELLFDDGRTLVCTPDHRIRTADGRWLRAEQLVVGKSEVAVGVEFPLVSAQDDLADPWSLDLPDLGYTLNVVHARHREQALAFARLLGYALTEGAVPPTASHSSTFTDTPELWLAHQLDVRSAAADIFLLTGERVGAQVAAASTSPYHVSLPRRLHKAFVSVGLDVTSSRGPEALRLPPFILSAHCPLSIVREFVGGLFGGGGTTLRVKGEIVAGMKTHSFEGLGWRIASRASGEVAKLQARLLEHELFPLLVRLGLTVEDAIIDYDVEHLRSASPAGPLAPWRTFDVQLRLTSRNLLAFARNVGFRHRCGQQLRLTAAASYYRSAEFVALQQQRVLDRAAQWRVEHGCGKDEAFSLAKVELAQQSVLHPEVRAWLEAGPEARPPERRLDLAPLLPALKQWTMVPFFLPDGLPDGPALPTYRVKLLASRSAGMRRVYDLTVPNLVGRDRDSFVANGCIVHNCVGANNLRPFAGYVGLTCFLGLYGLGLACKYATARRFDLALFLGLLTCALGAVGAGGWLVLRCARLVLVNETAIEGLKKSSHRLRSNADKVRMLRHPGNGSQTQTQTQSTQLHAAAATKSSNPDAERPGHFFSPFQCECHADSFRLRYCQNFNYPILAFSATPVPPLPFYHDYSAPRGQWRMNAHLFMADLERATALHAWLEQGARPSPPKGRHLFLANDTERPKDREPLLPIGARGTQADLFL